MTDGGGVLGDLLIGDAPLGGDGETSASGASSGGLLGDWGTGVTMLGGDVGEVALGTIDIDRHIRLHGESDLTGVDDRHLTLTGDVAQFGLTDRHVTLFGDVDVIGVPADRHLTLFGDAAVSDVPRDRHLTLFGDVDLSDVQIDRHIALFGNSAVLSEVERSMTMFGCATASALRSITIEVSIPVSSATRPLSIADDFAPVLPLSTFYT